MNIHVYKTTQEMGEEAAKLIAAKLNEAIAEKSAPSAPSPSSPPGGWPWRKRARRAFCSPRALPSLK